MNRAQRGNSGESRKSGGGGIWSGILIGFLAGLAGAAAVAVWVSHNNPFFSQSDGSPAATSAPAGQTGSAGQTAPASASAGASNIVDPASRAAPVDSHYDFYHILPGQSAGTTTGASTPPPAPASIWLQVGAFSGSTEADDLKARLALMGYEASIQTVESPDKGTVYRVRLGPYASTDAAHQVQSELAKNQIQVSVVNAHPPAAPASNP